MGDNTNTSKQGAETLVARPRRDTPKPGRIQQTGEPGAAYGYGAAAAVAPRVAPPVDREVHTGVPQPLLPGFPGAEKDVSAGDARNEQSSGWMTAVIRPGQELGLLPVVRPPVFMMTRAGAAGRGHVPSILDASARRSGAWAWEH